MFLNRFSKWIKHNRKRIAICAAVYAWSFPALVALPTGVIKQSFGYVENPLYTAIWQSIFLGSSLFVIAASWFAADLLPDVASSLGYGKDDGYKINVTGTGNVISIPEGLRQKADSNFPSAVVKEYDISNMLSPLDIARLRLLDHISKLRNNSVINLFIGIGIAMLGLLVLSTAIFQLSNFIDPNSHAFDFKNYALSAMLPKLSITLFVQIFSYFFLAMYRSNQSDIRYFQNEITLVDSLAASILVAQTKTNSQNLKLVISALTKNERNKLMKKNQRVIASNEEIEMIHALSTVSQISDIRKKIIGEAE